MITTPANHALVFRMTVITSQTI